MKMYTNYYIEIPTLLVSFPLLLKQVPRQQEDHPKHKGSFMRLRSFSILMFISDGLS